MGKINVGKLLIGGIVAGIVLNIGDFVINEYILKEAFASTFTARNVDPAAMNLASPQFVPGRLVGEPFQQRFHLPWGECCSFASPLLRFLRVSHVCGSYQFS